MEAFTIGNLLGRLFMSTLLVYVVLLVFSRLNFKLGAQRLRHPISIVAILALFFLGLSVNANAESGGRALRPFITTEFSDPRLLVYVPERPKWDAAVEARSGTHALILSTPDRYYPPASLEIVHNFRLQISEAELKRSAFSALNEVRQRSGIDEPVKEEKLEFVTLGELKGYRDEFTMSYAGGSYGVRSSFMIFENQAPVTIFLVTKEGQSSHITHMVEKILRKLSPLAES